MKTLARWLCLAAPARAARTPPRRRHGVRLLLLLALLPGLGRTEAAQPAAAPIFAATLVDLQDRPHALADLRGKPVLLNFWARWCGPCRAEIPELVALQARYRARGLDVVGVAIEDKTAVVQAFAKAYDMDYRVFVAKEQGLPLLQALGNAAGGLPFTLAIDRGGKVVFQKLGAMTAADMDAAAAAALRD